MIFWNLPFFKSVWPWIWPWTNGPRSNTTTFSESPYVNCIGSPILHKPLGLIFPCQKWTSLVILTLFFVKIVNIFLKIRYLSYWKTVFSYVIYRKQSVQEKLIRLFGWNKHNFQIFWKWHVLRFNWVKWPWKMRSRSNLKVDLGVLGTCLGGSVIGTYHLKPIFNGEKQMGTVLRKVRHFKMAAVWKPIEILQWRGGNLVSCLLRTIWCASWMPVCSGSGKLVGERPFAKFFSLACSAWPTSNFLCGKYARQFQKSVWEAGKLYPRRFLRYCNLKFWNFWLRTGLWPWKIGQGQWNWVSVVRLPGAIYEKNFMNVRKKKRRKRIRIIIIIIIPKTIVFTMWMVNTNNN